MAVLVPPPEGRRAQRRQRAAYRRARREEFELERGLRARVRRFAEQTAALEDARLRSRGR